MPTRALFDAGAFIALDRNDQAMWGRFVRDRRLGIERVTHAGVVAQVWRDPRRQARLAAAIQSVDVVGLSNAMARDVGLLLAQTRTADVIDGALACLARDGDVLYTSDPADMLILLDGRRLLKRVTVVEV